MKKLVAVRIDDGDGIRKVSGYVAREKNRARAWTLEVLDADKSKTPEFVEQAEKTRKGNEAL